MKRYEVISSRDGGVVFDAKSVDWEAVTHMQSRKQAAIRMARQNTDEFTGEILSIREVGESAK